jgi:two-component system nitrogen regulation response regulator GlnG
LAEETIEFLAEYQWPGNVRELENAIKRALVLHSGGVLTPDDFDFLTASEPDEPGGRHASLEELVAREVEDALDEPEPSQIYRGLLERVERPLLETVLARTDGNQIRAAALLGINRNTLRKKIGELEVTVPSRPRP